MVTEGPSTTELEHIDSLVEHFRENQERFRSLVDAIRVTILDNSLLRSLYHSARWRVKDPDHLRGKLIRKWREAEAGGVEFDLTTDNLFERINDLAGLRILHLHSTEFPKINAMLLSLLHENQYQVLEGPEAKVWDREYEDYFRSLSVKTTSNPRMYTSVHYVIRGNTRAKVTAEIQVRSLAEEIWGEVDHAVNYPVESTMLACREQIKVLARVTSSCTRLVDSIFASHNDGQSGAKAAGSTTLDTAVADPLEPTRGF